MRIKYIIFILLLSFSSFTKSYSMEADVFVQSTVNKASSVLSTEMSKEKKISELKLIAKETVDIKGIGFYTLGSARKTLNDEQKKKLIQLLFMMVLGAFFETLSISLVVPLVSFLSAEDSELSETISVFLPWTSSLNRDELIFYAMLMFVFIYLIKTFYMILLNSFQARYYYSIQSDISSRLFFNYNRPLRSV